MKKLIDNLVVQLSPREQKTLSEHIQRQYSVDHSKENKVFRDDIKDKVIELLKIEYRELENVRVDNFSTLEKHLGLDAVDITSFADTLIQEFELEGIEFSAIMEWQAVKDIVEYIENSLENKVGE